MRETNKGNETKEKEITLGDREEIRGRITRKEITDERQ
jgi:hypothetical protein